MTSTRPSAAEPARHKALCEARAAPWGSEPLEPLAKCVENLVLYIVQTIEEQAVGGVDGSGTSQKGRTAGSRCVDQQLTLAEVKVWNGMWKERPERTGMA